MGRRISHLWLVPFIVTWPASYENSIIYPIIICCKWNYATTTMNIDKWPTSRKAFSNHNFPELIYQSRNAGPTRSQSTLKKYLRCCLSQLEPTAIQLASSKFQRTLRMTPEHSSRHHLGEPECTIGNFNKTKCLCMLNEELLFPIPGELTDLQHSTSSFPLDFKQPL